MEKALTKVSNELYYYDKNTKRKEGKNDKMSGNCSRLRGDCSYLRGDCSGLRGDLTDCEITNEDRNKGINIEDLVK